MGRWLDAQIAAGLSDFRGQFGFFDGKVLEAFAMPLRAMVGAGGTLRLVVGANSGDPPTDADIRIALGLLGPADRTSLTVVSFSNGLFHPKTMHLRRADGSTVAAVGSSNFTRYGLGRSVEANLVLESAAGTAAAIAEIAAAIDRWATAADTGVRQVRSEADIIALLEAGWIETAATRRAARARARGAEARRRGGMGTRALGWRPPHVEGDDAEDAAEAEELQEEAAIPPAVGGAPLPGPVGPGEDADAVEVGEPAVTLLWQSRPLTRRDLNIPDADGTHATGSMNLDKGQLPDDVDHRHFFRDEVFNHLLWTPRANGTVEQTHAQFRIRVNGAEVGEFSLRIGHTFARAAAYHQNNAMTRLSWGAAREHVAREDLIDATLSLSRETADPTRFLVEIRR